MFRAPDLKAGIIHSQFFKIGFTYRKLSTKHRASWDLQQAPPDVRAFSVPAQELCASGTLNGNKNMKTIKSLQTDAPFLTSNSQSNPLT